jgi:3D (Asp-Asp-Asp) domain-containing protein/peptidoglycan hydrolase CwlO-like protein
VRASWYGGRARVAAAGLAVTAALFAGASAAADPGSLQAQKASLAAQAHQALLDLYALETKLGRAEQRVAALEERAEGLARREEAARRQLQLARADVASADQRLAARLQALYIEGETDPLAVLLGAQSLEEAISTIEGFDDVARQDREILAQVRKARARLRIAVGELAERRREAQALLVQAKAARTALVRARAERATYLASLRRQQELNRAQIARLTEQAAAAESRSTEISSGGGGSGGGGSAGGGGSGGVAPPAVPGKSGSTMTVSSTGYCLRGTTATGIPVAWGVIATDPTVIPLGTRMFVPGYGEGVAADTGSAVKGATIDLWFPTCAQALQWGRRTVTITLL